MVKNTKVSLIESNSRCRCANCTRSGSYDESDRTIGCDLFGLLHLKHKFKLCKEGYYPYIERFESIGACERSIKVLLDNQRAEISELKKQISQLETELKKKNGE